MAYFGGNGSTAFPATQTVQLEKAFRKRFRDQSIMSLITNSEWKGRFRGTGTEIKIPVLPVLTTYKTAPGEQVKYQTPKGSEESFYINRERAWGLHFMPEDKMFADFNIESPVVDEQSKVMGEDIEFEFLQDIVDKCAVTNTGDASSDVGRAGYVTGSYRIGSASKPVTIVKSDASGTTQIDAPDFIAAMAATLAEQPGGKQGSWRCIVPTAVAFALQTSELKQAELTGDATTTLRKSVKDIGNLAGMDIIMSDKIPFAAGDTVADNIYPIYALDTTAITFADEVVIKEKIQDKDEWGEFQRCKTIYDWFVRYPERFAVGYVKIG